MGLVIGGIWAAAAAANESMNVSKTSKALLLLAQTAQKLPSELTASSYGFLDFNTMQMMPKDFTDAPLPSSIFGMTPVSGVLPWGGAVVVYYAARGLQAPPLDNGDWAIILEQVPKSACVRLVTQVSISGNAAGLIQISNQTGAWSTANHTSTFPIAPNTILCANPRNDLQFYFSLH